MARTADAPSFVNEDDRREYHTLGGLAMFALGVFPGRVTCSSGGVSIRDHGDGRQPRVDGVLISRVSTAPLSSSNKPAQ